MHLQGRWQGPGQPVQAVLQLGQGAPGAAAPQTKADVVGHAQVRVERIALEHHRHIAGCGPQPADRATADKDFACGGLFQARQQPQQRALATTRGANQYQKLAVVDAEIEVLQHGDTRLLPAGRGARRVGLADLLEANVSQGGAPSARREP